MEDYNKNTKYAFDYLSERLQSAFGEVGLVLNMKFGNPRNGEEVPYDWQRVYSMMEAINDTISEAREQLENKS
jgi:hypothetical protein